MKRIFLLAVLLLLLLCGCTVQVHFAGEAQPLPETVSASGEEASSSSPTTLLQPEAEKEEIRAVWVSYSELNPEKTRDEAAFRRRVRQLLAPMQTLSVTDIFLHVRPFADSICPSALFASSSAVVSRRGDSLPFDCAAVFLSEAEKAGARVHAWINPYRVSAKTGDVSAFAEDPAVGALLKKKGPPCVLAWNGGVYLDPASADVQTLIVQGARELLEHYAFAGVHIDDYFYPTDDAAFDAESYKAYLASGGTDDLFAFRRENVSRLLRSLYAALKSFGAEKIFSVSPAADIERNENVLFADVKRWACEDGFCDWLIPQIYFGFANETRPFEDCAAQWRTLCGGRNVRLLGGLVAYKIGRDDLFAGSGRVEWKTDAAILKHQVLTLRSLGYDGFALFSASFLNFDKKLSAKVLKNLKDVL